MGKVDDELNHAATEYWQSVAKGAGEPELKTQRREKRTTALAAIETDTADSTDPLVLIVQAIRENSDVIKAATAEMTAARLAMAESERRHDQRASAMASDMSVVTFSVKQLTTSEDDRKERQSVWMLCIFGGFVLGTLLAAFAIFTLPTLWHNLFG
jgi:hypothetical protein